MKGLFIPGITAEMFRNGCLESIEALMAKGKVYDIDYTRWIPCTEKLPEPKRLVLCYITTGASKTYFLAFWNDIQNDWEEGIGGCRLLKNDLGYKVIAWMPLPEPYEAESEDKNMPNSLRCKIKHLHHNGTLTERECDRILKALEQEPCEDCISREQAIKQCGFGMTSLLIADCLRKLPSVTPTRPTGKWIEKEDYNLDTYYECSECGADYCIEGDILIHKYCPNCGAKMNGVETEVEDDQQGMD